MRRAQMQQLRTSSGFSCTLARCQSMKVLSSFISDQLFLHSAACNMHLAVPGLLDHACTKGHFEAAVLRIPVQEQEKLGRADRCISRGRCVSTWQAGSQNRQPGRALVVAAGGGAHERLGVLELLLHVAHDRGALQAAEAAHEQLRPHLARARHRACRAGRGLSEHFPSVIVAACYAR